MTHLDIRLIAQLILLITSITAYDERCPSGLDGDVDVFECRCYQFTDKTDDEWNNVKCSRDGGRLATVNTSALNKYLKSKIREVRPDVDHGFWIGGHRASKDGVWKWTDGSEIEYTNWATGEPNHIEILSLATIEQNCIYMTREHLYSWSSVQCNINVWNLPSICQYDIPDCVIAMPEDKINTAILIGIVVGAVVGGLLLCLVVCCIIVRCKSYCLKYRKRKQRQRSVKYYSRPASLSSGSHRVVASSGRCRIDSGENEAGENDLNEQLMAANSAEEGTSSGRQLGAGLPDDDDDEVLNVKGPYPTAASIAQEVEARRALVVDMTTGRATIKRTNEGSPDNADPPLRPTKTRTDNASTRSLKSFRLDGDMVSNQLSQDDSKLSSGSQSSMDDNVELLSSNLDNMDKPSSHPSKDLGYK